MRGIRQPAVRLEIGHRRAVVGGLAALVLGLTGCGTQTIVRTVTAGRSAGASATTQGTTGGAAAQQASIGDSIALTGNGGESMAVTVDQVMDPLTVGSFDQADSGQGYVGVQITLRNAGSVAYSDSPSNGATLLSAAGDQATSEIVSGGPCGNGFGSSAKIAPGESEQGCIAFELPTTEQPAQFQFTLDSGFADQTGEWTLTGSQSASSGSTTNASTSSGATSAAGSGNTQCDANISAGLHTSCPFAENVFRAVADGYQQNGQIPPNVTAKSPITGSTYPLNCQVDGAHDVVCSTPDGATVTFSVHSVQVY